jgi:hypothetical protein
VDIINSQSLTHFDSYYHRFTKPGTYTWGVLVRQNYTIKVAAGPAGQPKQWAINLTYANGIFSVDNPSLNISTNDYVAWHSNTPDPTVPVYWVVGDNGGAGASLDSFNSQRLGPEDAFSHLLMSPGPYQYTVTGGAGGTQSGSIPVVSPNPDSGAAVMVSFSDGTAPTPNPVTRPGAASVYVGDTILWDIVSGTNLVIKTA